MMWMSTDLRTQESLYSGVAIKLGTPKKDQKKKKKKHSTQNVIKSHTVKRLKGPEYFTKGKRQKLEKGAPPLEKGLPFRWRLEGKFIWEEKHTQAESSPQRAGPRGLSVTRYQLWRVSLKPVSCRSLWRGKCRAPDGL